MVVLKLLLGVLGGVARQPIPCFVVMGGVLSVYFLYHRIYIGMINVWYVLRSAQRFLAFWRFTTAVSGKLVIQIFYSRFALELHCSEGLFLRVREGHFNPICGGL